LKPTDIAGVAGLSIATGVLTGIVIPGILAAPLMLFVWFTDADRYVDTDVLFFGYLIFAIALGWAIARWRRTHLAPIANGV
jgi:hypothetical protein